MSWRKLGLVFAPSGERPWLHSHAALPTPLQLDGSLYRVYFAGRDERNRSHVGYADVDLERPGEVVSLSSVPVLAPGPLGGFDDHGVYPASLVDTGDELRMYTIGWNPGVPQPLFYSSVGAAVSRDGGNTFERVSPAPIMARGPYDPCLVTSPCVLREGDRWRMWYVSGFRWDEAPDGLRSHYHLKVAESDDGIDWRRDGTVAVELRDGETNIGRPSVIADEGCYRMWYCYVPRGTREYVIGYAESQDGVRFERRDEAAGIGRSPGAFDANALAYPAVFRHDGRLFMLYNGDGNGRTGFGLAVEE
jgi:predicted GH43/DUF377 family glycosyl hydrolase